MSNMATIFVDVTFSFRGRMKSLNAFNIKMTGELSVWWA